LIQTLKLASGSLSFRADLTLSQIERIDPPPNRNAQRLPTSLGEVKKHYPRLGAFRDNPDKEENFSIKMPLMIKIVGKSRMWLLKRILKNFRFFRELVITSWPFDKNIFLSNFKFLFFSPA
jgi:hypothetical protein